MSGKHSAPRGSFNVLLGVLATAAVIAAAAVAAVLTVTLGRSDSSPPSSKPTTIETAISPETGPVSPTPSQRRSSPAVEPKQKLVIHAAGDTNLDPSYISTYRTHGYGYAWTGMNGLFRRDDLTIVNLECAVSNKGSAVPKEFNFRGDPKALPAMRRGGVDIASMANNHSYDFGPDALVDTRQNLIDNRITPIGGGRDAKEAEEAAILHIKGWTIGVVAWDSVVDPYPVAVATPGHPGTAFGHDFNAVVREVRDISRKVDLTIVQVHWGVELDTRPDAYQVPQGHKLIDAGADMIFGGHSHRIQPLNHYKGKPIFWSLGNFVWPNFSAAGAVSGVAEVTVYPNGRIKAELLPAYISAPGHPVLR